MSGGWRLPILHLSQEVVRRHKDYDTGAWAGVVSGVRERPQEMPEWHHCIARATNLAGHLWTDSMLPGRDVAKGSHCTEGV